MRAAPETNGGETRGGATRYAAPPVLQRTSSAAPVSSAGGANRSFGDGLVQRPRLFEALDRGTKRRVTMVSGPAGSGKTLLVASWLRRRRRGRVAWVSVAQGERDAARFWSAATDALRACGALADEFAPPEPGDRLDEFVERLGSTLGERPDPVLLVVDDLHQFETREGLAGLSTLLERAPAQLRLLLLTRRIPRMGLHRLRVLGEVTEIRGAELAFTLREADELLTAAGVDLSEESLGLLHDRTEGWAAGLRLAALGLVGRADPDRLAGGFSGADRTVAEYICGEILAGQPRAVRRLLRRTSVLERVNGPLADLLTGRTGGERKLQDLEDANALVVSLDPERSWFRYHHLLVDLLRMELRRDVPANEIEALHLSAARWHAGHDSASEAIRHAQAGRDWRYAGDLLMVHWFGLLLDRRRSVIGELLAGFPPDALREDAALAALTAADYLASGRFDVADAYLALAERLAAAAPEPILPRFELMLAVVRLERARARRDLDAAVEAANAFLAPAHGDHWVDFASDEDLRTLALMHLGVVEMWAWHLEDSERHLREGLALARRLRRPYVAVGCLGALAELANLTQRLELAEDYAREAIELADGLGWSDDPIVGAAASAMGGALLSRGLVEASESWLNRADSLLDGRSDADATVLLRFKRGVLRFLQGRFESARRCFREAELALEHLQLPPHLTTSARTWQLRAEIRLGELAHARAALAAAGDAARGVLEWCNVAARLHLAEDDPQAAVEWLAPALDGTATGFRVGLEIEALLLEALARDRLRQPAASEAALERMLERAEPAGLVWIVMTVPDVRSLLKRHPRHRTGHAALIADLLDHLGGGAGARAARDIGPSAESLSGREREVLGFLPTNLTAAEIAAQLVLSVHTVKTHMRSVYAKLGVHRRADAVERARAIGLLGPARRQR
jgi:LuxR family maltose regulon positive regulatory protein